VAKDCVEKINSSPVDHFIDSIGAGDGFSAMFIAGLLQERDYKTLLERASLFAAKVYGVARCVQ